MAKILVIGDPHLKISSQALATRFLSWVEEVVQTHKPDKVVNLGDTFHTHNVIRSEIMAIVDAHVKFMHSTGIQYDILVGNHDMAHHKTPDVHAWLPYVGVYEAVRIVQRPVHTIGGISYIPYIDDPVEFQQHLATAMQQSETIFCHQTFRGANFGFITTKEGALVPEDYKGQIISGHIHKSQSLGCVWYPGTPFAQEAADHNEVKGIYLYDSVTGTADFLEAPLPRWVTTTATPATFADAIANMDKANKNHLVIEGPGLEVAAAVDSKTFKDLKKEYGFSVKKQSTSSEKSSKTLKKVSTVEDAVVEYIDSIYDGSVDKTQLKSKCLEALQ